METDYLFEYTVFYYDEENPILLKTQGLTIAPGYTEAMHKIILTYGEGIENIYLECIDEAKSCLELSPFELQRLKEKSVYYNGRKGN